MAIYGAVLFFLLSPGVLFRFPSKKPVLVLAVHAVLFAIIYQLTYKAVYRQIYGREGFANSNPAGTIIFVTVIVVFGGLGAWLLIKKGNLEGNLESRSTKSATIVNPNAQQTQYFASSSGRTPVKKSANISNNPITAAPANNRNTTAPAKNRNTTV